MSQVKNILVENNLDYRIDKIQLTGFDANHGVIDTDYYGLLNTQTGKVINTVKKGYEVTQNEDIVGNVLEGMQNYGEVSVHKAYSIGEGKKIAIQLAIEGKATVNGDEIKRYVTIIDSNDGSSGLGVGIGDLTMSCKNQFFAFYKASQIKARHTKSIRQKVANLSMMIGNSLSDSIQLVDLYRAFESTKVSRNLANDMVKEVIGFNIHDDLSEKRQNSIDKMNNIYDHINHQMNEKGDNLWGLHSGITRFTTHDLATVPTKQNKGRQNVGIERMLTGNAYKMNQKSMEFVNKVHQSI